MTKQSITTSLIFAAALILASVILKQGIVEFKTLDRSVSVKGLAEKEVMANTVIWPINYSLAGNDLTALIGELETKNQAVRAFLALHGFADDEVSVAPPNVADKLAQPYAQLEKGQMHLVRNACLFVAFVFRIHVFRKDSTLYESLHRLEIVL